MCEGCVVSPKFLVRQEKQKQIEFMLGLNETYIVVRSNLLMMNLLPSLNCAYSILTQEENRGIVAGSTISDLEDAALYPSNNSIVANFNGNGGGSYMRNNKKGWICTHCGKKGIRSISVGKKHRVPEEVRRRWNNSECCCSWSSWWWCESWVFSTPTDSSLFSTLADSSFFITTFYKTASGPVVNFIAQG